ncbi:MAG: FAD-dependent oxidoreductase [Betaproteobacteria bacterium]|nr:FAD-dependent oxidoreductase [Betaproteobacteria bacterium]
MRTACAIVGGGLSGLQAASLLHRRGVDCRLFEARERLGGRILSLADAGTRGRFDLGPAWFWPDMQPRLRQLVTELGLSAFEQRTRGAVLVERFRLEAPQRYERGFNTEPRSMRLRGGMQALTEALAATLPSALMHCGVRVAAIRESAPGLLALYGPAGELLVLAERVILALPPRLVARIAFTPALPEALVRWCENTPTWMAGQAKCLALYAEPFWVAQGLSGTASSFVGPMMEMHDASLPDGSPALFGFMGLSAAARQALGEQALKEAALAQWARLFGPQALDPLAVHLVDWAQQPDTATPADGEPPLGHPAYGVPAAFADLWAGRLILSGTETAAEQGGYLEGALEAAEVATQGV